SEAPHTLLYYESPYRLVNFLKDALEVFGDRPAALANDLTKMFEKVERGTISSLLASLSERTKLKGEYIVIIAGNSKEKELKAVEQEDEYEEDNDEEDDDN